MEQKNYKSLLQFKSDNNENLIITGYASVFDTVDNYNDIIASGAFKSADFQKVKLLWQHDHTKPIGIINRLYEDEKGLFLEASINCNLSQGRETALLIKQGAVDGLSIGFTVNKSSFGKDGSRVITDIKLWEISVVTFPANSRAQIVNATEKFCNHKKKILLKEKNMNIEEVILEKKEESRITQLENKFSQMEAMLSRPEIEYHNHIANDNSFTKYLRSGFVDMEIKALSGVDNNTGGYTIIPELYKEIIGGINAKSPMRRIASIETISTNALDILMEEGNFATGWVAENAERDETNTPRLAQKRILVHELYAQPKATQKLLDDSAININAWLSTRLQDSFVRAENNSFIVGDGNNKPRGILSYGHDVIEHVAVNAEGTLVISDILNLINHLEESYLANASFLMHRSTLLEIQKLHDENGRFLWQPAITNGAPDTLFGIPVICSADMPRFAGGALGIALADFREAYKIVDRTDMSIMRDPFTEKPFIKFYSVKRVGGDIVNTNAIKIMRL